MLLITSIYLLKFVDVCVRNVTDLLKDNCKFTGGFINPVQSFDMVHIPINWKLLFSSI